MHAAHDRSIACVRNCLTERACELSHRSMFKAPATTPRLLVPVMAAVAVAIGAAAGACGSSGGDGGVGPDLGSGNDTGVVALDTGGSDADSAAPPDDGGLGLDGPFNDFPSAPILDTPAGGKPAPASAPGLFGAAGSGDKSGGPCLVEPELGSLFPRNWLRPRFHFVALPSENLFEIRLHADKEKSDLVVYTTSTTWTMPKEMWQGLATHVLDTPITVTIRGAVFDGSKLTSGPSVGSTGTISIASASADGSIVYWMLEGTVPGVSVLKGFTVGQEDVQEVLRPAQAGAACIGCHSSTPDGLYVAFSASDDPNNGQPTRVLLRAAKDATSEPPFLSASAKTLLSRVGQHGGIFSKAHWSAGDHVALTLLPVGSRSELLWTDLEATTADEGKAWGVIKRDGDPGGASAPTFSHDGKTIVYFSSSPDTESGYIAPSGQGDLWTVPYNARAGGIATQVPGANDPAFSSYLPAFSPDDALIAFNRSPRGIRTASVPQDEVFVTPASGGVAPTRLVANDPPACSAVKSPGVTNSWPKWAPQATTIGGKTYYWLTFSSTRNEAKTPQLYVAGVVVEGTKITSYPALYLWNQPAAEHNHTPAWDVFALPPPH